MKVNKDTLSKLRTLYFNLTGNSAVLDDYSFFKYLCNNGSWIQCFWLCKIAIDKMLQEGKKPTYKLYNAKSGQALPFETVNNYYHFKKYFYGKSQEINFRGRTETRYFSLSKFSQEWKHTRNEETLLWCKCLVG